MLKHERDLLMSCSSIRVERYGYVHVVELWTGSKIASQISDPVFILRPRESFHTQARDVDAWNGEKKTKKKSSRGPGIYFFFSLLSL